MPNKLFSHRMLQGGGGGVRFTIWSQTSRAFYAVENREKLSNFTKKNNY